jgi:predicted Zn-dependent protease
MNRILIFGAACLLLSGLPALADEVNKTESDFEAHHVVCLEKIADDAELAYEDAMIWQSQGGGRRARHCVAMTLFALGHADEAAFRLDKLAKSPDGGSPQMRAGYYVEAADMWINAELPGKAYDSATAGLKIVESDVDLRIARARAHAAMGRWDYAETELTNALVYGPDDPRALRYRADARKRQNKLTLAKADIDKALIFDGQNVDALLVRGEINEAMRLAKLEKSPDSQPTKTP